MVARSFGPGDRPRYLQQNGRQPMTNTLFTRMSRNLIASAVLALIVGSVFFSVSRVRTPAPLTPEETREVTTAIKAIAPSSKITNLRRDRDGDVRAFLPGDPEGGRIVVVTKRGGDWHAAVETYCF